MIFSLVAIFFYSGDQFFFTFVRGALKLDLSKNLVFCPNQVDPHPPPRKLGHPKLKKKN